MNSWQKLLFHLFKEGKKWKNELDRADWRKSFFKQSEALASISHLEDDYDAQAWIKGQTSPAAEKRKGFILYPGKHCQQAFLVLVPFARGNSSEQKLSLQLGFFINENEAFRFFGYRYETPEGIGQTDAQEWEHNFFHAQPIQALGHGAKYSESASWYPDRYPSFNLGAQNELELVMCVLISIWEWSRIRDLTGSASIDQSVKNELRAYLDRMNPLAK